MKAYLISFWRILTNGVNIAFWVFDATAIIISSFMPDFELSLYHHVFILSLGYIFSSIAVVAKSLTFPAVAIYLRGEGDTQKFRIRNMSESNLRDVHFDDIEIGDNPEDISLHFTLKGDTNFLKPDEETDIMYKYSVEGKVKNDDFFFANLIPEYASDTFELNISYSDVPGNRYETSYTVGKDKINMIKPPKLL